MKGIVHMCKGGVGVSELEHDYRALAKRCEAERKLEGSRVYTVVGDARGAGVIMTEPGFEHSMLAMLEGPHAALPGKAARQTIISLESMPDATTDEYDEALSVLSEAAAKWVETYAPNCRWVAFVHQDRHHPHIHIAFENWDYKRDCRLDITPAMCSEMQSMRFCSGLGIESGKGSLGRVLNGQKLAEADVNLTTAETWHQRVEICAWSVFAAQKEAAKALLHWCAEKQPKKSVDGLLDSLLGEPLPVGWEVKSKTKAGGDLRKPAVKIAGCTLRLETFLDKFAPRVKGKKKSSTKDKGEHER